MKFSKVEKLAFITMGVTVTNAALMGMGIETMPGMWVQEVYDKPGLGISIGGLTGIGIGGAVGAAYIAGSEVVKSSVEALRGKFSDKSEKKLSI